MIFTFIFPYFCIIMNIGKLHKTKLLKTVFLWSLLFVFMIPQFIQLIHQFDGNDHGHHEMHQPQELSFHHANKSCGIFSFEYSSFQEPSTIFYSTIAHLELLSQVVFPKNRLESATNYQLQLLRAPPLF